MSPVIRTLMFAAAAALVSGCTSRTPLALAAPQGEPVTGFTATTVYTGSREHAQDARPCRASYTGAPSSSVVLLEVQCNDGNRGIGTGLLNGGRLVGGTVRMRDGNQAVVRVDEAQTSP